MTILTVSNHTIQCKLAAYRTHELRKLLRIGNLQGFVQQVLSDGESDVFIEAIGVYLALVNVCIAWSSI